MKFNCPECETVIGADNQSLGKNIRCFRCDSEVREPLIIENSSDSDAETVSSGRHWDYAPSLLCLFVFASMMTYMIASGIQGALNLLVQNTSLADITIINLNVLVEVNPLT